MKTGSYLIDQSYPLHMHVGMHTRELLRGSLFSNPVLLGLLLDKVRRKRLLCVSGKRLQMAVKAKVKT